MQALTRIAPRLPQHAPASLDCCPPTGRLLVAALEGTTATCLEPRCCQCSFELGPKGTHISSEEATLVDWLCVQDCGIDNHLRVQPSMLCDEASELPVVHVCPVHPAQVVGPKMGIHFSAVTFTPSSGGASHRCHTESLVVGFVLHACSSTCVNTSPLLYVGQASPIHPCKTRQPS